MGKAVKYFFVTTGGLVLLFCAALLIGPYLIDVEQFKPKIEQLVTQKTGYPLTIRGDIDLSVFPWIGLSFTDLKLDNPEGYQEKKFLTIQNFQARLKLLPLLSKRVEIHRFVVDQPEIFLTRDSRGFWNWQDPESDQSKDKKVSTSTGESLPAQKTDKAGAQPETQKQLGIESLLVGECALTNGSVIINDLLNGTTRELSDINLTLQDVSLDKPIVITLRAHLNDNPIQLAGSVGPVTSDPFVNRINFDIDTDLFKTLALNTAGYIENLAPELSYNVSFKISPFSPKHLFSQLDLNFPTAANNPGAFETIEARGNISGTKDTIALSDSEIIFDDSRLLAELRAKEFSSPDLEFHLKIDTIDIDRYLPPDQDKNGSKSSPDSITTPVVPEKTVTDDDSSAPKAPNNKSTMADELTPENAVPTSIEQANFDPLRRLVMTGDLAINTIKLHGGVISNLTVTVDGKDGLFNLTSLKSELYQGSVSATGQIDLSKVTPVSTINMDIQNVQAGPLLRDFADKDIIEGALQADLGLTTSGMSADQIKASLNGKGELLFQDGAIIGIDLAQLARNIKSGFTLDQQGERPKTDFAELHAPFTISNGLVDTKQTTLKSPFIRVNGSGTADLVSESIDFRLNPKLVGTIKGQGDKGTHSGIAVPVIVGGTFDKPTFSPDLEAFVKQQGINREEITEILETGKISPERKKQMSEEVEKAKSLLKGLLGN